MRDDNFSHAARQQYFWALYRRWPEVLNSLQSDVSPIYRPNWHTEPSGERVPIIESWNQLRSDVERKDLLQAVHHWAAQYRITEEWIFETALDTLMRYARWDPSQIKDEEETWLWRYNPRGYHPVFAPKFEPDYWYPNGWPEEWEAFKNRVEKEFSSQLAEYRRLVERKFGIGKDKMARDAEWTVLYHKGVPALEIARGLTGYDDPEQTVYRAVKRFANSIGLALRKNSTRCTGDDPQ